MAIGIETVTVTKVGTQSSRGALSAEASAGATNINVQVRGANGFAKGDKMTVGTPANHETVTITAVGAASAAGASIDFTPALVEAHLNREFVVAHGTGLDLGAPLETEPCGQPPFQR